MLSKPHTIGLKYYTHFPSYLMCIFCTSHEALVRLYEFFPKSVQRISADRLTAK